MAYFALTLLLVCPILHGLQVLLEFLSFLAVLIVYVFLFDSSSFFFLCSHPRPSECDLYYVNRDTLFSYHKDSEMFLQVNGVALIHTLFCYHILTID